MGMLTSSGRSRTGPGLSPKCTGLPLSGSTLRLTTRLPELAEDMSALTGWSNKERADAGDFALTRGTLFHLCYSALLHRIHAPDHARRIHLSLQRSMRLAPRADLLRPGCELILWHRASIRIAVEIIGHGFNCHWYAKNGTLADLICEAGAEYDPLMESIHRHVDSQKDGAATTACTTNLRIEALLR
ncbi:MAG: hypothetical protein HC844_19080 [Tabrizicola sp.]|nr:hypothetical protein [Tabrizicola sp.]